MTDMHPPNPPGKRHLLYQYVNSRLRGVDLADYLRSERDAHGKSFRQIAIDLINKTGVDVTHEAVRRWYRSITQPTNNS